MPGISTCQEGGHGRRAAAAAGGGGPWGQRMNAEKHRHTSNFRCGRSSDRTNHRAEFHRLD
eukprot:scaffold283835_cov15-Tisochrysis_lutea.AAC.1